MTTGYDHTGLTALAECVGKVATFKVKGLEFEVRVVDVRRSYGTVQYKVAPMSGIGEQWVQYPTVTRLRDWGDA